MAHDKPIIGVLALQGAVELHRPHIEAAGAEFRAVKTPAQFAEIDAFILPGGESTTMLKLIEVFDLWDDLEREFAVKPVWGICAGTILMASTVLRTVSSPRRSQERLDSGDPANESSEAAHLMDPVRASSAYAERQRDDNKKVQKSFGLLPIEIERNGYGRQLESHDTQIEGYGVSFIRAPIIKDAGDCDILAMHNGKPAWVQKGRYVASAFHPEVNLDAPSPMHQHFVDLVRGVVRG
jgi:5'-phosphate synthase pdxT subunit